MRAFKALLGLNFKSLLLTSVNIGRGGKKGKSKAATGLGALIFISALMVYLSVMLSISYAGIFAPIGRLDVMLAYIMLMAVLFPLMMTIFGAQSLIYSTKDIDIMLSLPVSAFTVMLSRVLALYLEILLMCEMLLLPAGVVYLLNGGPGGARFMVLLVVEGIFLSALLSALGVLFGGIVSYLSSRMRRKNLFNILISIVLMLLLFVFLFRTSGGMAATANLDAMADEMYGMFTRILPPIGWAISGLMGNWGMLVLFLVVCGLPLLLVTWVFSLFYKPMLTRLASHAVRRDFKLGSVGASGSGKALFMKEMRRFFGTPVLVLNAGIAAVMLIGASIFAVVKKNTIATFLFSMQVTGGGPAIDRYLGPVLLLAIGFMGSLMYASAVSISLEGKSLWILKSAPVGTGRIFLAKAGFDFLFAAVTQLICMPLLGYAFGLGYLTTGMMLLVALLLASFSSISGLFINLLFPRLDAENEAMVVKNSASVLVTMLANLVVLGLFVGLFFLLKGLDFVPFLAVCTLVLAALNVAGYALLNTRGRRLFAELL